MMARGRWIKQIGPKRRRGFGERLTFGKTNCRHPGWWWEECKRADGKRRSKWRRLKGEKETSGRFSCARGGDRKRRREWERFWRAAAHSPGSGWHGDIYIPLLKSPHLELLMPVNQPKVSLLKQGRRSSIFTPLTQKCHFLNYSLFPCTEKKTFSKPAELF